MRLSAESANLEFDSFPVNFSAGQTYNVGFNGDVNWRTVLGDMYNKYDYFYIVFNSFGGFSSTNNMTYTAGSVTGISTGAWQMAISGDIQFVSNSGNGQLTNIGIFPDLFPLPQNGNLFTNSPINNGIIFRKPLNSISRITIAPYFLLNNQPAVAVLSTGSGQIDVNYSFVIYGMIKE
jgi:hypothetical protein